MLADRREELTRARVQTVNRLQRLLSELIPGVAKKDITALQAKGFLASVRPRDAAGKTRRRIAVEHLSDLVALDKKIKSSTKELKAMVIARGSTLMDLPGVGHCGASQESSAADLPPHVDTSDQPLPRPANLKATPTATPGQDRSSSRSRRPVTAPTAAVVKRGLLDDGEDRRTLDRRERTSP